MALPHDDLQGKAGPMKACKVMQDVSRCAEGFSRTRKNVCVCRGTYGVSGGLSGYGVQGNLQGYARHATSVFSTKALRERYSSGVHGGKKIKGKW